MTARAILQAAPRGGPRLAAVAACAARSARTPPLALTRSLARGLALAVALPLTLALAQPAHAATFVADPAAASGPRHYRALVAALEPGDTLELPAGTYGQGLDLQGVRGRADAWITITGPADGPPAIVTTRSRCCNAVQLGATAYVAIKHLTVDANSEGVGASIDAINAKGAPTHDILIEHCVLHGAGLFQGTVGISTKSTAWNWTIRGNVVREAGTGAYLGNSDGSAPFVAGLIEHNLFVDTIGYNLQIKYQNPYTAPPGMPNGARRTIVRHNVFVKRRAQTSWPPDKRSGARPNLLVGGFPASGAGAEDRYEIYGNFFFGNPDGESLIQASGRVSIHDNVFAGALWASVLLRDHDRPLEQADVYNNTIYGGRYGIRFESGARGRATVVGNVVFADVPISGPTGTRADNVAGTPRDASRSLEAPAAPLGRMSLYPRPGTALEGAPLDLTAYAADTAFDRDFDGRPKGDRRFRGAYAGAGDGATPAWRLDAARKPPSAGAAGSRAAQ